MGIQHLGIADILFHQRKSSIIRNVRRIKMRKLLKERLRGVMIWRKLLKHQKHQRLICFNITGSWTTNKTGNWKSTRIQVDNDRGIMKSGVIAHEIGHAFGLSHRITNKNSIMCQTQYGRKVQTVQNTDWETFKHIYGY